MPSLVITPQQSCFILLCTVGTYYYCCHVTYLLYSVCSHNEILSYINKNKILAI